MREFVWEVKSMTRVMRKSSSTLILALMLMVAGQIGVSIFKVEHSYSVEMSHTSNQTTEIMYLATSNDQAKSSVVYNESFGGSADDEFRSGLHLGSGAAVFAGKTESYGAGGEDLWVFRTPHPDLNLTFGGPQNDGGNAIALASGKFMVAGYTESFGAGLSDVWLVCFDSWEIQHWNKTFGGSDIDVAYAAIDVGGDFLIAGVTYSFGSGNSDFWLIRVDNNGNHIWNHTYGGTGYERPYALVECQDGGFAVLGYTDSFGSGMHDMWLVKTDSSGNALWNRTYGGPEDDEGWGITECEDGGFALTGYSASFGAGSWDMWLIRTDSDGQALWNATYGDTLGDYGKSVIADIAGCYIVFGATFTDDDEYDYWLVIANNDGELVWNENYGGEFRDRGECMVISDGQMILNSHLILAGYSSSYDGGFTNGWVLKVSIPLLWIDEPEDSIEELLLVDIDPYRYFSIVAIDQWWINISASVSFSVLSPTGETTVWIVGDWTSDVGDHAIEFGMNNSLGHNLTASYTITIQDTTPPYWITAPSDITLRRFDDLQPDFMHFEAGDYSGVDYSLTGSGASTFTIRMQAGSGILSYNLTELGGQPPAAGEYSLTVNAFDPYNNVLIEEITVTILERTDIPVGLLPFEMAVILIGSIAAVVILAVFVRLRKSS
jgi:hypothetical protein